MDLTALAHILSATTREYRNGPAVVEAGPVVAIFDMPPAEAIPPGALAVDVHFCTIAVDREAAGVTRDALVALLATYDGPNPLSAGPSYIEVGAALGDQGATLRLFALGQALGFWTVVTPAVLGFSGPDADALAGGGFVMITGYDPDGRPPPTPTAAP